MKIKMFCDLMMKKGTFALFQGNFNLVLINFATIFMMFSSLRIPSVIKFLQKNRFHHIMSLKLFSSSATLNFFHFSNRIFSQRNAIHKINFHPTSKKNSFVSNIHFCSKLMKKNRFKEKLTNSDFRII